MKQIDSSLFDSVPIALEKALEGFTLPFKSVETLGQGMRRLMEKGFDDIPFPGRGSTLLRWRSLAEVACIDLSLARLRGFEEFLNASG